MRYTFLVCLSLLVVAGCNDVASFDKPQPPDSKPLLIFPSAIRGHYINKSEASSLTITANLITMGFELNDKISPAQVDTSQFQLTRDSLINKSTGEKYKVLYSGDSLTSIAFTPDTFFNLSNNDILKKYKGYYFLNSQNQGKYWSVHSLSLSKGLLILSTIKDSLDIKELKKIAEKTEDSTGCHFNPTQKQFAKFIKQNGFRDRDTFYRISNH